MGTDATTISQRLRVETADAHLRIEQSIALTRDAFTINDLRLLLIGFYGFHRTWEPAVALIFSDDAGWFDARRKLPMLEADLRALNIDPQDPSVPICQQLPRLDDRFHALGSMYVMEGSTLGGQLIGRFLIDQLSLHDGRGYSYFLSYGGDVGLMWRRFNDRLAAEIKDPSSPQADRVVAAANETFKVLADWLMSVRDKRPAAIGATV